MWSFKASLIKYYGNKKGDHKSRLFYAHSSAREFSLLPMSFIPQAGHVLCSQVM